jgi:hypothetical protein
MTGVTTGLVNSSVEGIAGSRDGELSVDRFGTVFAHRGSHDNESRPPRIRA